MRGYGINLKINQGELFALLGTNGAGKTTTIKMLSTLILPTTGEIKINGLDYDKYLECFYNEHIEKQDIIYGYLVNIIEGSLIAVVSMVRRGSVLVSFLCGALFFREKNLRSKAFDLLLVLLGMLFLYLGTM